MRTSIDLLTDKLERQVNRYREKRRRHGHRQNARTACERRVLRWQPARRAGP